MVLKKIALESGTTNSHNPEQDTCHWQSMSCETPLRFNILLKEIFSKSRSLRAMKKNDENDLMVILQEFGPFKMMTVKGCSETALFREWSKQVLHSL